MRNEIKMGMNIADVMEILEASNVDYEESYYEDIDELCGVEFYDNDEIVVVECDIYGIVDTIEFFEKIK